MKTIKGKTYQALGVDAFKFAHLIEDVGLESVNEVITALACGDTKKIEQWNTELWLHDLLSQAGFNFRWDAKSKTWRLWMLGLETNAYAAESKAEAKADAVKYLVERGRIYAKWGNSNDTV